jgi:hypothetical protein
MQPYMQPSSKANAVVSPWVGVLQISRFIQVLSSLNEQNSFHGQTGPQRLINWSKPCNTTPPLRANA